MYNVTVKILHLKIKLTIKKLKNFKFKQAREDMLNDIAYCIVAWC